MLSCPEILLRCRLQSRLAKADHTAPVEVFHLGWAHASVGCVGSDQNQRMKLHAVGYRVHILLELLPCPAISGLDRFSRAAKVRMYSAEAGVDELPEFLGCETRPTIIGAPTNLDVGNVDFSRVPPFYTACWKSARTITSSPR